jgi:hypothetical protein
MNAAKSGSGKGGIAAMAGGLSSFLRGTGGFAAVSLLVLAALVLGAWFAWRSVSERVTAHENFQLTADNIAVTPPPPWIRTDVKAEVVQAGSLERLSILDPQVTVRVAQAFATHSWVETVKRVSKRHPAAVDVVLAYRRPVAMVEVNLQGQPGLLPIDAEAVVLPSDDFAPSDAARYPRIAVGDSAPLGPVGTRWGDQRVADAATVATLLSEYWSRLNLYRIAAASRPGSERERADASFELVTRDGLRVVWGHAPGKETVGEAIASQKLARLLEYVDQKGSLGAAGQIDLRDSRQMTVVPASLAPRNE